MAPAIRTVPGYGAATPQIAAENVDVFTDPAMESNGRAAPFSERARLSWASSRPQGDYGRDGRPQKTRDWSRTRQMPSMPPKRWRIGKIAITQATRVIVVESDLNEDVVAFVVREVAMPTPFRRIMHTLLRFLRTGSKHLSMELTQQIDLDRQRSHSHLLLQLRTATTRDRTPVL